MRAGSDELAMNFCAEIQAAQKMLGLGYFLCKAGNLIDLVDQTITWFRPLFRNQSSF
jgi:hypothetical protein